jgi:hypothetical protein
MRTHRYATLWSTFLPLVITVGCASAVDVGGDWGVDRGGNDAGLERALDAAETDAGVLEDDVGLRCPVESADPRCPPSGLRFALSAEEITPPRDHHTTLSVELEGQGYLYVFGGTQAWASVSQDVQRARLGADGELERFEVMGALPEPLAGHATVHIGRTIIVAGGNTDPRGRVVANVYLAELEADGSLGPWRAGPPLPEPVMHHTCDVIGRRVYCIGGRIRGNYTGEQAVYAELDDTGALGPWREMPPLPRSIGFHQTFVHAGALYLAGGLHRDPPATHFERPKTVLVSRLGNDGLPSAWVETTPLPENVQVGAATVVGNEVYLLGGLDRGDHEFTQVLRGTFDAEGALTFVTLPEGPLVPRGHVHQAPVYAGRMYLVGGHQHADNRSLDSVEVVTLTPP